MIIKSSASLLNDYSAVSALAKETQEPIYITKDGEGDLVIMNMDAFERREELIRLECALERAETESISGTPYYSLEESKKIVDSIYGI